MASDTIDQTQLDIANQLLSAMDKLAEKAENISNAFKSQSDVLNDINDSFNDLNENTENHADSLEGLTGALNKAYESAEKSVEQGGKFTSFVQEMQKGIDDMGASVWLMSSAWEKVTNPIKSAGSKLLEIAKKSKVLNKIGKGLKSISKNWKDYSAAMKQANGFLERWVIRLKAVSELTKSLMGGMVGLLKSAVSSIGGIVSGVVNVIKSATGMVTKFLKLALTLPFEIAQAAASLGGKLRQELFEVVIQAGEETKQYFDQASDIGMGMKRLTNIAAGSLKAFQSVNSEVTKLFGYGAQGAAAMIKETSENINAMGHFSEIFAGSITKNSKNIKFLAKAQRALGLSGEDFGYLALDAASNSQGLQTTIAKTAETLDYVSRTSSVDFKRLSKNFFSLRKDIVNFGHLTNNELANLTAKMTQMGVKMEDAAALFGKFSTFEDAANASAMLSQTFGMNVDAMKLIEAQNPGEIIDMFRHAMFETGRSFDDLNRHEKSLMAQHTGMSAESLKMIMNFRRMGYTYEESKQMMEDSKPEARQLNALKGLNSSITQFQKTLNFKSPFEAFFKGLTQALSYSPELRRVTQLLSGSYEGIYEFALGLKGDEFKGIVTPIIEVVKVMKSVFGSQGFKTGLKTALSGISNFVSEISGYGTKKQTMSWTKNFNIGVKSLRKSKDKTLSKKLIPEYKKIFKSHKGLLKKAGIRTNRLKRLTIKDTTNMINQIQRFVENNPEYRKAFGALGDSLTKSSINLSSNFKPTKKNKKGLINIAEKFVNDMQAAAKASSSSGNKVVELSGQLMSLIIQGGAYFGLGLLKLFNAGLDFIADVGSTNKMKKNSPLLAWLKITPKEFKELKKGYGSVLKDIFKGKQGRSSKFAQAGKLFAKVFTGLLAEAFGAVAGIVSTQIKKLFGFRIKNKKLLQADITRVKNKKLDNVKIGKKPISTPLKAFKSSANESNIDIYGGVAKRELDDSISDNKSISPKNLVAMRKLNLKIEQQQTDEKLNIGTMLKARAVATNPKFIERKIADEFTIASNNKIKDAINKNKSNFDKLGIDVISVVQNLYESIEENNTKGKSEFVSKLLKGKNVLADFSSSISIYLKNIFDKVNKKKKIKDPQELSNTSLKHSAEAMNYINSLIESTSKIKTKKAEDLSKTANESILNKNTLFNTPGGTSLGNMTLVGEASKIFNKGMLLSVNNPMTNNDDLSGEIDIGLTSEDAESIIISFDEAIDQVGEVFGVDLNTEINMNKFAREFKKYLGILGDPHGAFTMRLDNIAFNNPSFGNTTPTQDFNLTETTLG